MGYDNDFYTAYEAYLAEPSVRFAHDWVFKIASLNNAFDAVIDLGCGCSQEFYRYGESSRYLGVDINAIEDEDDSEPNIIAMDYRSDRLIGVIREYKPRAFVSLFSSEITALPEENYLELYEKIFRETDIEAGLVSGFYYESKKHKQTIKEAGGITSIQTIDDIEDHKSEFFTEKRLVLPVPSEMFGSDVFEVWKILERKV